MRVLAFLFFTGAAFDWPGWVVDRAGMAALGLAFLSLAVGAKRKSPLRVPMRVRAPAMFEEEVDPDPVTRAL